RLHGRAPLPSTTLFRSRFVAGQDQADLLLSQLGDDAPIITEPERRDTFPAVALAAAHLHSVERIGPGETVVVLPVDPYAETDFLDRKSTRLNSSHVKIS